MKGNTSNILLLLMLGIALGDKMLDYGVEPPILLASIFVLIISAWLLRSVGYAQMLCLALSLTSIGAFLYLLEQERKDFDIPDKPLTAEAIVISRPVEKKKSYACDILVTNFARHHKLKAYFEKNPRAAKLQIGQRLEIKSRWQKPDDFFITPHFNYKDFLLVHNFSATTFVRGDSWKCLPADLSSLTFFEKARCTALLLRKELLEKFQSSKIGDEEFALLAAMTLGDRSFLTREMRDDYSAAGAAHVLALSGLHLSIIIAMLSLFVPFIPYRAGCVVKLVFVWSFVFLSGMSVSIMRVAMMFTIMIILIGVGRQKDSYNTLFFAALLILIFSPTTLFDVSFQLSFTAVYFIIVAQGRLFKLLPLWVKKHWLPKKLISMLTLTFLAQVGTLPIILYHFGQLPVYGLLTNLFVGFFATIVLTTTVLALLLPPLRTLFIFFLDKIIYIFSAAISFIANLPCSAFSNLYIGLPAVLGAYFVLICIAELLTRPAKKRIRLW